MAPENYMPSPPYLWNSLQFCEQFSLDLMPVGLRHQTFFLTQFRALFFPIFHDTFQLTCSTLYHTSLEYSLFYISVHVPFHLKPLMTLLFKILQAPILRVDTAGLAWLSWCGLVEGSGWYIKMHRNTRRYPGKFSVVSGIMVWWVVKT